MGTCISRWCSCCTRTMDYLLYKRNPIFQCLYLFIILGAYATIVVCVYPRLPMTYLPEWHKQFGAAVMLGAVSFWAFICRSDPGIITAETVGQFLGRPGYYEPDGRIYQPGTQCRTTGLPRPARSKFCAISEVNVARFDHYCPWLGVAVGEKNYRYFLGFLAYHLTTFTYAAFCMVQGIRSVCHERRLWTATFVLADGTQEPSTRRHVATYIVVEEPILAALLILTGVLAVFIGGFFTFHLSLVWRGMTTNEYYKWKDIRSYHSAILKAHNAVLSLKEKGALEGLPLQLGPIELGDITCDSSDDDDDEDSDAVEKEDENSDSPSTQTGSSTEESSSDTDTDNNVGSMKNSSRGRFKEGGSSCGTKENVGNGIEDQSSKRSSSSSSSDSGSDSDENIDLDELATSNGSNEEKHIHKKGFDRIPSQGSSKDASDAVLEKATLLDRESSGAFRSRTGNSRAQDSHDSSLAALDTQSPTDNINEGEMADLREVRELVAKRAGLDVKHLPALLELEQFPGPTPRNEYNLGFVANFYEVFFPRCEGDKIARISPAGTRQKSD